jgi:hypothetical protein
MLMKVTPDNIQLHVAKNHEVYLTACLWQFRVEEIILIFEKPTGYVKELLS